MPPLPTPSSATASRHRRLLTGALVLVLFLALVPLLGLADIAMRARLLAGRMTTGERYTLPPPAVLRALTFGYNEVGADLLWVRTIAYFTEHLFGDRDLAHIERHLENIFALDDRFKAPYRYGSSMIISKMQAGHVDNRTVHAAINVLKRAHERFPDDWRFPFYIGGYYMTELRAKTPTERQHNRRQAADWIRRAALLGTDMAWLPSLAASLYTEHGERDVAIRHLQELYLTTQDPAMKQQIMHKLKDLQAAQVASELQTAGAAFNADHQQSPLSYVPADLYALIQLPAPTPIDL